jgi:hypothetical protein
LIEKDLEEKAKAEQGPPPQLNSQIDTKGGNDSQSHKKPEQALEPETELQKKPETHSVSEYEAGQFLDHLYQENLSVISIPTNVVFSPKTIVDDGIKDDRVVKKDDFVKQRCHQ